MGSTAVPEAPVQEANHLVGMNWLQLPQHLLVAILQHIPEVDRLSTCALVSSSWCNAAAAATSRIVLEDNSKLPSLRLYLDRHGECLTALTHLPAQRPAADSDAPAQITQLPCPRLLDLQLEHCAAGRPLQLGPGGQQPGLLQAATGLTSLSLRREQDWQGLVGGAPSLAALTALPHLQDLSLHFGADVRAVVANVDPPPAATIPCAVLLPALLQLTVLSLTGAIGIDTLQPVSRLTKLRSLCLAPAYRVPEAAPAGAAADGTDGASSSAVDAVVPPPQQQHPLLPHLTCLKLAAPGLQASSGDGGGYSWLEGLPALQVLELGGGSFEPRLLRGMPQLVRLGLDDLIVPGEVAGQAELVSCICSARHLTALQLSSVPGDVAFVAASAAFRHLNQRLRHLHISAVQMPVGGWQGLFGMGRRLPALEELHLSRVCVTEDNLRAVLACCTSVSVLTFLQLVPALMDEDLPSSGIAANWRSLLHLTDLTRLTMNGIDEDERQSLQVLAQLTSLQELVIKPPVFMSIEGTFALTALTQLTALEFRLTLSETDYPGVWRRDEEAPATRFVKEPDSTLPAVWYQLLMFCAGSAACRVAGGALRSEQEEVLQQVRLAGYDTTLLKLALAGGLTEEQYQARYRAHMAAQGLTPYQVPINPEP